MNAAPLSLLLLLLATTTSHAAGRLLSVTFPASDQADELRLGVTYTLWIPEGVERLRAIIVHQHGCGSSANAAGETAAHDLHWQALATKWDAALLAPRYRQTEAGREGCELWMEPRKGSRKAFLRAIEDFATQSAHPELNAIPWCLWGHSGGAYWSSLMQTLDPQRVVAVFLRSGTAFAWWESEQIERPALGDAVFRIPVMLNPGIKESADERPIAAWLGSVTMFKAYRAKGAPIGFAADPLSGHDCGGSRYLAIPYFDACLALRLPDKATPDAPLRAVDPGKGWLAEIMGHSAQPAALFKGKRALSVWLPDERVAKVWERYVTSGTAEDATPPPAPTQVKAVARDAGGVVIKWDAVADLESGLAGFIIERDGVDLARLPEKPVGTFGPPLFQTLSFHDTPETPLPEMRFIDTTAERGVQHRYRVIAINTAGLKSEPASP